MEYSQKLLEDIGLDSRRIQMINISSAMGGQFAWSAAEITEEIRRMGPNPLSSNGRAVINPSEKTIIQSLDQDSDPDGEV